MRDLFKQSTATAKEFFDDMTQASSNPDAPHPNDENEPQDEQLHEEALNEDAQPQDAEDAAGGEEAPAEEAYAEEAPAEAEADPLAEAEAKLAEMKDQLLRAVAETENVRRRAQRDVEEASKFAVSGFARDMIDVGENLHLALNSIPEEARNEEGAVKAIADGVEMTLSELKRQFEKHGIIRVNPLGEKFDHNLHQAISQIEDPSKEPGTVLQVVQAGYTLQGRLLRPAMVVVSKQGETQQKVDTQA